MEWKYYNHAMIPNSPPHAEVDTTEIKDGTFFLGENRPLLARWTTDFDCGNETDWWYVIKDTPFDISSLKAKRRYEINKGNKFFDVKVIEPCDFKEELFSVQIAAFATYPKKYRPKDDKASFFTSIESWNQYIVFGIFYRLTNELAGYALLSKPCDCYVGLNVLKTNPEYEKLAVNAALVAGILQYFNGFLKEGGYICDGARSINHETKFQDYLEKYFGFRKAYCYLHIMYNPRIKWAVYLLYPLRRILHRLDGIGLVHQVNSVLYMEEICRKKALHI